MLTRRREYYKMMCTSSLVHLDKASSAHPRMNISSLPFSPGSRNSKWIVLVGLCTMSFTFRNKASFITRCLANCFRAKTCVATVSVLCSAAAETLQYLVYKCWFVKTTYTQITTIRRSCSWIPIVTSSRPVFVATILCTDTLMNYLKKYMLFFFWYNTKKAY